MDAQLARTTAVRDALYGSLLASLQLRLAEVGRRVQLRHVGRLRSSLGSHSEPHVTLCQHCSYCLCPLRWCRMFISRPVVVDCNYDDCNRQSQGSERTTALALRIHSDRAAFRQTQVPVPMAEMLRPGTPRLYSWRKGRPTTALCVSRSRKTMRLPAVANLAYACSPAEYTQSHARKYLRLSVSQQHRCLFVTIRAARWRNCSMHRST